MNIHQVTFSDYSQCSPHFINGVEFLKRGMLAQAAHCFELAYEQVKYSDTYYSKYASFCGYTRMLSGDRGGLSLCREVARNELHDADVFFNLARLEWRLNDRKRAVEALTNGFEVDDAHQGLQQLKLQLGFRRKKPIAFLPRDNVLNNRIGRLFRR